MTNVKARTGNLETAATTSETKVCEWKFSKLREGKALKLSKEVDRVMTSREKSKLLCTQTELFTKKPFEVEVHSTLK